MIPVAPDLGLTETYGTTSVLSISAHDGKLDVEEAVIPGSVRSLIIRQSSVVSIHENVKREVVDVVNEGIPRGKGVELFMPDDVFDPCMSSLVGICVVGVERFAAFTTGEDDRILVLGRLNLDGEKVRFGKIKALDMKSVVKQVEMIVVSGGSIVVSVRTREEVHLLKIQRGLVTKVFMFCVGERWADIAYATVRYFEDAGIIRMAVIDEVGKFEMYESIVNETIGEFYKTETKFESIYDPVDLSHFKKLVWLDENRLLLFSRIQLHEYNLKTGKLWCRISAGIWSKLLDIAPNSTRTLYYLLTSKEVIVVDASEGGFRRRYAWKHYLNDTDTSMYVKAARFGNEELCIVASKQVAVSFVFRFTVDEIRMIETPTLFLPNTNEPWVSFSLVEVDEKFVMLFKVEDAIRGCFVDVSDGVYDGNMKKVRNVLCDEGSVQLMESEVKEILDLSKYYKFAGNELPNSSEITRQIYDRLEQFLDSGFVQMTLFQITSDLHIPRRVENVCKIVEYMIRNNRDEQFDIFINRKSWMTDKRICERVEGTNELLEEHVRELRDYINDEMVVFYLFLSSIEVWKRDETFDIAGVEVSIAGDIDELGDEVREVISRFDDDFTVVGIYDSEEEVEVNEEVVNVWSIPTVGISQQRKRVVPKGVVPKGVIPKGVIPETIDSQSDSQRVSQGSQRRRKRRRGGF